jgi:hypothetical protein
MARCSSCSHGAASAATKQATQQSRQRRTCAALIGDARRCCSTENFAIDVDRNLVIAVQCNAAQRNVCVCCRPQWRVNVCLDL